MEDQLVGTQFRQLARLDAQLGESLTGVLSSVQTHAEAVLNAQLKLERVKRNHGMHLVELVKRIEQVDKTYAGELEFCNPHLLFFCSPETETSCNIK